MYARSLLLVSLTLAGCSEPATPEVVEVREWDEGCDPSRDGEYGAFPPDTIAYPPGRRAEFRIVSLGGCVDSLLYREERRIYAVLDSLGVPDSSITWPYDARLRFAVLGLRPNERPTPVDSAFKVVVDMPPTTFYAIHGFSPDLGVLWTEVHHGPSFRLVRVQRSTGESIRLAWEDETWPLGGPFEPQDDAFLDSLREATPPPPPPPRGV